MSEKTVVINKSVKSSMAKRRISKFCKNKFAVISAVLLTLLVLACVCAPLLTPHDPNQINVLMKYADPSKEHPLGCDRLGRDLLARALYGGRWSLVVGFLGSLGSNLLGTALGLTAAYFRGKVDRVLVTIQEFVGLLPTMLILILIGGVVKINIWILLLFWTLTGWGGVMRSCRSRVLSLCSEPFIESCVANGIPGFSILFHHILPNALGAFLVSLTTNIGGFILSEAGLSYLGYGLDSSIPTWGNLMNATKNIEQLMGEPLQWIVPGFCILLLTLCVNFIGDGLRDAVDATSR